MMRAVAPAVAHQFSVSNLSSRSNLALIAAKARAMWQMSDFEAVVFILIVAAMVALAVAVAWP